MNITVFPSKNATPMILDLTQFYYPIESLQVNY